MTQLLKNIVLVIVLCLMIASPVLADDSGYDEHDKVKTGGVYKGGSGFSTTSSQYSFMPRKGGTMTNEAQKQFRANADAYRKLGSSTATQRQESAGANVAAQKSWTSKARDAEKRVEQKAADCLTGNNIATNCH